MYIGKCKVCGIEKEYKYKSFIKETCSHKCSNTLKWVERIKKIEKITLKCKECNSIFEMYKKTYESRSRTGNTPKFCCKKCADKNKETKKEVKCLQCGKIFKTTRSKLCSRKCSSDYMKANGTNKKNGYWYENGYKVLYVDGDNSIKEHIKVMEDFLGRKLLKNEVIHHINEIRDDNRLENLKLMTKGEHSALHRKIEIEKGKKLFKRSCENEICNIGENKS